MCFRVLLSGVSLVALHWLRVNLRDRAGRCGGAEGQGREQDLGMHLDDRLHFKAHVCFTLICVCPAIKML